MAEWDGRPRFVVTGLAWFVGLYLGFTAAWRAARGDPGEAWPWAVGAVVALAVCALAFRTAAARAIGPAGSPARRTRRLSAGQVAKAVAIGVGAAGLVALLLLGLDGGDLRTAQAARVGPLLASVYASTFLWNAWWANGEGARPPTPPTSAAGRALLRVRRLLLEPHDVRWPRRQG
jgi:hypothetical protein